MCKHDSTSLVQAEMRSTYTDQDGRERAFGPFLTWQCDLCGAVLPLKEIDAVTLDAWDRGALRVPTMDYAAYRVEVEGAFRQLYAGDVVTLETFAKVARGS
jgi:hypothetical protein